jgi:hypothetical protein
MIDLVEKLLAENGYNSYEASSQQDDVHVYVGDEFEDIVVITGYSRDGVLNFFDGNDTKTAQIMGLYEDVLNSTHSDSAKDMLLIICYQVDSPSSVEEDNEVKRQIMRLEENKFGMRISVLKYTNAAKERFENENDIAAAIVSRVDSGIEQIDGSIETEKTIDAALRVEPTFTALQLYTKLPFLSIRRLVPQASIESIEQRLEKCIGDNQAQIDHILKLEEDTYSSWTPQEFLMDLDKVSKNP